MDNAYRKNNTKKSNGFKRINNKIQTLTGKAANADLVMDKLQTASNELLGRMKVIEDDVLKEREEAKRFRDKLFTWAQNTYNEYYCGEAAQKRHERELDRFKARVELLGAEYVRSEEADEAQSSKASSQYWASKVDEFLSSPLCNSLLEGAQALWEKSVQRKLDPPQCEVTIAQEEAKVNSIRRQEQIADLQHKLEMAKLHRQLESDSAPQYKSPVDSAEINIEELLKMSSEEQLKYLFQKGRVRT